MKISQCKYILDDVIEEAALTGSGALVLIGVAMACQLTLRANFEKTFPWPVCPDTIKHAKARYWSLDQSLPWLPSKGNLVPWYSPCFEKHGGPHHSIEMARREICWYNITILSFAYKGNRLANALGVLWFLFHDRTDQFFFCLIQARLILLLD